MITRLAVSIVVAATATLVGCAHGPSSGDVRLNAIRRAQVWTETNVSAMDIKTGPAGQGAFPVEATVTCDYIEKKMTGRSPKFTCVIPPDDEVKVKYGTDNGEVYAEVAATRLLWALGFGADRMYPVRVVCKGCPSKVVGTDVAAIERKMDGKELESDIESGWAWRELDLVDPEKGGATRAQRDALKLLAVFMQHTDSKSAQQRLLCVGESKKDDKAPKDEKAGNGQKAENDKATKDAKDDSGECEQPFMLVQDVGLTFGRASKTNGSGTESASFTEWAETPIWKDSGRCVGNMRKSLTGTLKDPEISEEGRKFLANLLMKLTDQQIRDLFDVSRFSRRPLSATQSSGTTTVDQWVDAFKRKRTEIANHVCPS